MDLACYSHATTRKSNRRWVQFQRPVGHGGEMLPIVVTIELSCKLELEEVLWGCGGFHPRPAVETSHPVRCAISITANINPAIVLE